MRVASAVGWQMLRFFDSQNVITVAAKISQICTNIGAGSGSSAGLSAFVRSTA